MAVPVCSRGEGMTPKLTKAQSQWLEKVEATGFVEAGYRFGGSQKNRPLFALEAMGLVQFGFGPKDCMFQTQGFMPILTVRGVTV